MRIAEREQAQELQALIANGDSGAGRKALVGFFREWSHAHDSELRAQLSQFTAQEKQDQALWDLLADALQTLLEQAGQAERVGRGPFDHDRHGYSIVEWLTKRLKRRPFASQDVREADRKRCHFESRFAGESEILNFFPSAEEEIDSQRFEEAVKVAIREYRYKGRGSEQVLGRITDRHQRVMRKIKLLGTINSRVIGSQTGIGQSTVKGDLKICIPYLENRLSRFWQDGGAVRSRRKPAPAALSTGRRASPARRPARRPISKSA